MKVTLNMEFQLLINILMKQGCINVLRMALDAQSITWIIYWIDFTSFEMYSSSSQMDKSKEEVRNRHSRRKRSGVQT